MVDQKMKNTKRTLNISKTLFGMVDEMDSTDFCAQKESNQVVLMKEKSEPLEQIKDEDQVDSKNGFSTDIVDLVTKIEQEMATYRYSKLKSKSGKNTQRPPETLHRQTAHPFFMDSTYLQDS